jgi:hypothetical protein
MDWTGFFLTTAAAAVPGLLLLLLLQRRLAEIAQGGIATPPAAPKAKLA